MRLPKFAWLIVFALLIPGVGSLKTPDLCIRIDMKPVLTIEQLRQNELVDFLMELSDLKDPQFGYPDDISGLTPEELYEIEVGILIEYGGFPPIFQDVEADRVVNRRYFQQVMFEVAMQNDEQFADACGDAVTDTEKTICLEEYDYVYSGAGKIYRNEILSVLCNKREEWKPTPELLSLDSVDQEIEIIIEEEASEV